MERSLGRGSSVSSNFVAELDGLPALEQLPPGSAPGAKGKGRKRGGAPKAARAPAFDSSDGMMSGDEQVVGEADIIGGVGEGGMQLADALPDKGSAAVLAECGHWTQVRLPGEGATTWVPLDAFLAG
mgnify:CR=1 FL=1